MKTKVAAYIMASGMSVSVSLNYPTLLRMNCS
ncbi:Uncharacterised protein [Salmonella enterica subsp. arizonae]|nr:Uncharacterised protein [Salmonella enterica subsp. arizonae]